MADEFDFLVKSSCQVFLDNWKQVEKKIVEYAEKVLKTDAGKVIVANALDAEENYGSTKVLLFMLLFQSFCLFFVFRCEELLKLCNRTTPPFSGEQCSSQQEKRILLSSSHKTTTLASF